MIRFGLGLPEDDSAKAPGQANADAGDGVNELPIESDADIDDPFGIGN